jgi:hypothetical protein
MSKLTKSPNGRLKALYALLENNLNQLDTDGGAVFTTKSTQGEPILKQNPRWKAIIDLLAEIRMIEVEEGKTALGKERRKKLSAEARKLSAEADDVSNSKTDNILDFLS